MEMTMDEMIEAMMTPKKPVKLGQSIWQIAQRSNAKEKTVRIKQVSQYKRVGIL